MSSKKNRDLAQELVDFLLSDDKQKPSSSVESDDKKSKQQKPALVPPVPGVPPLPVASALDEPTAVPNKTAVKVEFTAPVGLIDNRTGVKEVTTQSFDVTARGEQPLVTQRAKVAYNEVTTLMAGVEAVKVAQARIGTLEKERDKLRDETEQLLTSTEALQRRLTELKAQYDNLERKHKERIDILEDEKAVMKSRLSAREDELERIKKENDELKLRFQNDLRKIRVRERELEHRQELMKAESASLIRMKDEMILELRRQLEKLHFELDNFRSQSADLNQKMSEFYDRNHRTVKALRLALSVLETGDADNEKKKAGSS